MQGLNVIRNWRKMKCGKWVLVIMSFLILLGFTQRGFATDINTAIIPPYVSRGLQVYADEGYEAAVHVWLADSPYKNATTLASNIAFFKNIEKLAGNYQSYDILMTKQTISSNVVYVRMNYARLPGYVLFTSLKRDNDWVLGKVQLDRLQRFGGSVQ